MADSSDDARERHWWIRFYDLVVRRFAWWLWTAVIVAVLVSGVVAWAFTPWKTDFSKYPVGSLFIWLRDHRSAFLIAGVCLLALLVLLVILHRRAGLARQRPKALALTREDRRRLLTRIHSLYETAVKQSLWGVARVDLGLSRTFEATVHPALLVSYRPADAREEIAPGTPIITIYEKAGDGLLILGKPGAGKSTLLYELALALVERAEHDATPPLPLVVSLTSWATTQLPLSQWLVEELVFRYQIPRAQAAGWLEADQLMPLLDGLDEMAEGARSACIEAINLYRQDHPLPLVVCSRSSEYFAQEGRLSLQSTVEVQPLTRAQVQRYLAAGKRSLEAVRVVLDHNPVLQELLTTPLLLSVVILAYQGKTKHDLPQLGTAEEQQQQIFASYIRRMLERPVAHKQFAQEQTYRYLTWLAQKMQQHQLTEFYLERLQPAWLPTKQIQVIYSGLVGLVDGLVVGSFVGLAVRQAFGSPAGLVVGFLVGLIIGVWLAVGLYKQKREIKPVEAFMWSWKGFWRGLIVGSFVGPLFGLIVGLVFGLLTGLIVGLVAVLAGGLVGGLSGRQINEDMRIQPNQGIQNSGRNALRVGLVSLLLIALATVLATVRVTSPLTATLTVLFGGLFGGLVFGGEAYFEHYVLRCFLWSNGAVPWHYVRFLEESTKRILLHRVGGGYRFIHPLFLDYFASGAVTASLGVAPLPVP